MTAQEKTELNDWYLPPYVERSEQEAVRPEEDWSSWITYKEKHSSDDLVPVKSQDFVWWAIQHWHEGNRATDKHIFFSFFISDRLLIDYQVNAVFKKEELFRFDCKPILLEGGKLPCGDLNCPGDKSCFTCKGNKTYTPKLKGSQGFSFVKKVEVTWGIERESKEELIKHG